MGRMAHSTHACPETRQASMALSGADEIDAAP